MATFQVQVEDYIGTYSDTGALTEWLTSAARKILNIVPEELLAKYATYQAITNNSTNLAEYIVYALFRQEKVCKQVDLYGESKARDSSSSFYATEFTPVYRLKDGVVRVYPTVTNATFKVWMKIYAVDITQAGTDYMVGDTFEPDGGTYGDGVTDKGLITVTQVNGGTGAIEQVTITYAGNYEVLANATLVPLVLQNSGQNAELTITSWAVYDIEVVSGGTGYSSDHVAISFSGGGGSSAAATATSASGVITAVTVTAGGTNYTSIPTVTATGNLYAYSIAYPSVAYGDSSITDFPPSLIPAVVLDAAIKGAIAKAFTSLNVSSAIASFTTPSAPSVSVTAPTWTDATLGTFSQTTIGSLGTAPTYSKPVATISPFTDSGTALAAEDIELSEGHLNKQRTYLENYQLDMQNELNEFNKELAEYQTTVQKAIEQARLDQERLMLEAKTQTDLNIQNEIQDVANEVNVYRLALEKFSTEIQLYGQQVNAEATKLSTLLGKAVQESQGYLALVPALKSEYNDLLQAFLK